MRYLLGIQVLDLACSELLYAAKVAIVAPLGIVVGVHWRVRAGGGVQVAPAARGVGHRAGTEGLAVAHLLAELGLSRG